MLRGAPSVVTRTQRVVPQTGDEDKERGIRRLPAEAGFGDFRSQRAGAGSGAALVFATRP